MSSNFELYLEENNLSPEIEGRDEICIRCGTKFKSFLQEKRRQFCPQCLEKHIDEHSKLVSEYAALKVEIQHEAALRKIEKSWSVFSFRDISQAAEAIRQMEEIKPESFLSTSEIITAIVLYDAGFFFKINHKIGKYKIDFYIPEYKICLEVDSGFHDIRKVRIKDGRRDIEIRQILGNEWETVRIPTQYIDRYPMEIPEAMLDIAKKQRQMRKDHNGLLPDNYSRSVKAYYKSANPDRTIKVYNK